MQIKELNVTNLFVEKRIFKKFELILSNCFDTKIITI